MKMKALLAALTRLCEADPAMAEADILYDGDKPVEGGIIGRRPNGPALILAPIRLDQVGGF